MTSARSRANHGLYLARLLLQSWQAALDAQDVPARALDQAFLPAVREHLLNAYGWFLLEVSGAGVDVDNPPHSCAELPAVAPGKAISGEIREFQQLEVDGWLAELLAAQERPGGGVSTTRAPGNLLVSHSAQPHCDQLQEWAGALERLFDRMGDSLDEC